MSKALRLLRRTPPVPDDPADAADARFSACYETERQPLRRYIRRLTNGVVDADDVTQEAFARLWREFQAGVIIENPRAWLYRVAMNLVTNRVKSKAHTTTVHGEIEDRPGPWDLEGDASRRQLTRKVLARLSEPMRQALLLWHAGFSGKEIADVLGVKTSYVSTLVLRAHERFRREVRALESR